MTTLERIVKKGKTIIAATAVAATLTSEAIAQEKNNFSLTPVIGFTAGPDRRTCTASTPETVRSVPFNPTYSRSANDTAPIPDRNLINCQNTKNKMDWMLGAGYNMGSLTVRSGMLISGYNPYNHLRGEKNSAYYRVLPNPVSEVNDVESYTEKGVFFEAVGEIMKSSRAHIHLFAGFKMANLAPIKMENGWVEPLNFYNTKGDDMLVPNNTFTLFKPQRQSIEMGFELGTKIVFFRFSAEYMKTNPRPTNIGMQSNYSFPNNWMIMYGAVVTDMRFTNVNWKD